MSNDEIDSLVLWVSAAMNIHTRDDEMRRYIKEWRDFRKSYKVCGKCKKAHYPEEQC